MSISMTRDGLAPGQSWLIPAGPLWQARLDRGGRAHVIGAALAEHEGYRGGYADRGGRDLPDDVYGRSTGRVFRWIATGPDVDRDWARRWLRRRWHADFDRACRAAAFHERMVVAAAKQKVGDNA